MSALIASNFQIQRREMPALPLKSLPLGFRFHPKDEELVNHYLKGKIDGRIRSEIEVIPEIDFCKCEPWDLPDKSLIRSDDPEWFFFAAKDRKYPNGHRSNRATKAGYWKATGKDRTIRSRSSIVGMKKTLVFHRGRAPKGVRTCWIMHEYRTTEPEYEFGEQGGYVLYRLFKKPDDKSLNSNFDVVEANGFSPAPSRSSPDDTHHEADVLDVTPMNQVSPESDFLDPKPLPSSVKMHPGIERWFDDISDCSTSNSVKPEGSSCNGIMDSAAGCHEAELGLMVDNILGMLEQSPDPQFEPKGSDAFRYHDYPSSGNFILGHQMGPPLDDDDVQHDSLDEFLSTVFSNQEEFCSGGSMTKKDLITEMLPEGSGFTAQPTFWDSPSRMESMWGSDLETDTGVAQGAGPAGDWTGSSPASLDRCLEMANYSINHDEWANLLPYESVGPDVYSLGSNTTSLQAMFSSMDEPANGKNSASNDGIEETGIQIRARRPQGPASSSNLLPQQGQVLMRNRLQRKLEVGPFSCWNTNQEDKVATTEEGEHKSVGGEDLGPDLVYMLEELSIDDDLDSTVLPEKSHETKSALRSRKTVAGDSGHDNKASVLNKSRRKWVSSSVLLAVILMLLLLLLLLVGLWNRKSFQ